MNETPIIETIQGMLAAGQINENDRKHADDLVNKTASTDLTVGNLNWMTSLHARGGKRFQSK